MDDDIWIALVFSACAGGFIGMIVGANLGAGSYKAQAIERGYALYCPADGDWAWVGDCDIGE